jgi:hypothetical protein
VGPAGDSDRWRSTDLVASASRPKFAQMWSTALADVGKPLLSILGKKEDYAVTVLERAVNNFIASDMR